MLRSISISAVAAAISVLSILPASAASPALYTMTDYGTPPTALDSNGLGHVSAFNNTGQIVGVGNTTSNVTNTCIAYTGKAWISLMLPTAHDCAPNAVSDLHGGVFDVVGGVNSEYELGGGGLSAFYAVATATGAAMNLYGANYPSNLMAVSATGTAIGDSGFVTSQTSRSLPSYRTFYSTGTSTLLPVDPCLTVSSYCPEPLGFRDLTPRGTNGIRAINASNTFVAVDISTGYLMEETLGKPNSAFHLAKNFGAMQCYAPIGIDDGGGFFYQRCPSSTSSNQYVYRYDVTTQQSTLIPPIAGSDCAVYIAWTMNGKGEVYGNNGACNASPSVMWVYDPVAKTTTNLSAQLPPNLNALVALNDLGQILTGFGSPEHWVVLSPPK